MPIRRAIRSILLLATCDASMIETREFQREIYSCVDTRDVCREEGMKVEGNLLFEDCYCILGLRRFERGAYYIGKKG